MPPYRIRKNHSNAVPRRMIFFDTETHQEKLDVDGKRLRHHLRLGHAISGRWENDSLTRTKEYTFAIGELFWNWAFAQMSSDFTTWIVCHNAVFDLTTSGLWRLFEQAIVALDMPRGKRRENDASSDNPHGTGFCCLDDPPTIIGCRHLLSGSRFVVIDTLNYFRTTLEDLGNAVSLPKLQKPDFNGPIEPIIPYCIRDCEITARTFIGLLRFVRSYNLGMFRYTAPSQSMSCYRHRFMRFPIECHDRTECKELERQSYYGGQTEIFYSGRIAHTVYQLDCTAMYPAAMQHNEFPRRLKQWKINDTFTDEIPPIKISSSIAQVYVETGSITFPKRRDGITQYCKGRFLTTLAGPELSLAANNGCILTWGNYAEYDCVPLFTEFVTELWKLRLQFKMEGNKTYEKIVKLLMNSLYGKFGQKSQEWVLVPGKIPPDCFIKWTECDLVKGLINEYRSVGWEVQQKTTRDEIESSFPAISAFATSYGRLWMRRLREIAGEYNVYYQGTDSLLVNTEGKRNLDLAGEIAPFQMGKLRECYVSNFADLRGKSVYKIGSKIIFAGRKLDSEEKGEWQWEENQFSGAKQLFQPHGSNSGNYHYVQSLLVGKNLKSGSSKEGFIETDQVNEPFPLDERMVSCDSAN